MKLDVSFQDVLVANKRLKGRVTHTPTIHSPVLSEETNAQVYFKMEALQKTGSFKVRGALNKIDSLTDEEMARGVITASAGNHAQGVAYAASLKGISAKIVVPENTPKTKQNGVKRLGGELVVFGENFDKAEEEAYRLEKETGRVYIEAFEDDDIIAGQGTSALEALLENPEIDTIVVPAGGGGLLSGVALVAKSIRSDIKVYGVQTHASPPWYYSFRAGKLVDVEYKDSVAEGLHGGITQGNLDLILKLVDDFILVEEEDVKKSISWLANTHQYMAEGSAVVGITALQQGLCKNVKGKNVLVWITGGNIDGSQLADYITQYPEN